MSQWNNSYAYNNQYQSSNSWNGDTNAQYMNQTYYPSPHYDPNNQYVSFNEFLSQMQSNNAAGAAATNYNNVQYQNCPSNQYNYQTVPSTAQNAETYTYASNTSNVNDAETYQAQNQYNVAPDPTTLSEVVFKSNLTATATEFVPKSSTVKSSSSSQHVKPESSKSRNGVKESKSVHGSSSNTNWRERPSSSSQEPKNRQDFNYKQDSNNHSKETSHRHESNRDNRNYEKNQESRNYEPSNRESRYESRNENSRNYENRHEWGQKGSKSKNKDADRTFYNSSMSKEARNGRESSGRSRNYVGSSRLKTVDRNITEDEQYASSYLQFKDNRENREKEEKVEKPPPESKKEDKKMTQRERLTEQLNKGTLECLVCCERVRQTERVWSCSNCYHVLHLRCIKKWATSSLVEGKWRCPACQNMSADVPSEYWCMCGAVKTPEHSRGVPAHCCGRSCKRPRACPHACPYQCHPGPCPPCNASITKRCGCGAETRAVVCSSKTPLLCGRICNRLLACGLHNCNKECHEGACGDCPETITQVCYCSARAERAVPCSPETSSATSWSCGGVCSSVLQCGVHSCAATCHPPPCAPCPLAPDSVAACPCGHTQIKPGTRTKCTDPIPLCDNICAKPLSCGPPNDKHFCKLKCHQGECPVCPEKTVLQCRCGHSSREVPCADLPQMYNNVFCQKKCNKKLSCGRHRCRAVCCAEPVHRCGVVCGRLLSCQLHRCEEFCHTGHCAPCPTLSWSELSCACGASVSLPPVRCGARPPACAAQCARRRPCGHAPLHACHSGDCPPCVVLTAKMCHGKHEERKTIPCSLEEFSCGLPCGKPLPCGKHTCIKICHKGPCDTGKCMQPCNEKRPSCGHGCAAPCHADNGGACPSAAACRRTVRAQCQCGRRSQDRACADNARDRARIVSALTATKMQEGGSVEISDNRPGAMLKTLECDDECRVEARTRQLALALQIRNPDVSAKLAPRYGEHVRATATREPAFALHVHHALTDLVQRAKKSKQKTRSHSFPSMNWQKRQFIHELCEHFGCESVAYDAEPNRNVVATADREKSWLPAMSVLEVLAREAGKRRVPGPVLRAANSAHAASAAPTPAHSTGNKTSTGWATLTSTNAWAARSQVKAAPSTSSVTAPTTAPATPAASAAPKIDYFDNPPE